MIRLEWWWLLLALPLPWVVRRLGGVMRAAQQSAALRTPFLSDFESPRERSAASQLHWPLWLAAAAWVALVLAGARPQWLGDPANVPASGRDLMLAVDLSGSMEVRDFELGGNTVTRLAATKAVARQFIQRREGDRVGLILFGSNAYLQAPLTFDRTTVDTLLMESAIGLAGKQTAIGDAIGLAVKRLRDHAAADKVLILVTDGANTAGSVDPVRAASLAATSDTRIYTIGIGAEAVTVNTIFGKQEIDPSRDLDEEALTRIAEKTGGRYFRARDTAELEGIYGILDQLEPVEQDPLVFRPVTALFMWPLALGLGLIAVLLGLRALGRLEQ